MSKSLRVLIVTATDQEAECLLDELRKGGYDPQFERVETRATMAAALTAAETGHLVFTTAHAPGAPQAIDRIMDMFPPHQQSQVRSQLSLTLRAVVSQVLLPRTDGKGRVAAREIMFVNQAIQNLIREDKIHQIANVITTSGREDMLRLDDSLADLVDQGLTDFETAYPYFDDSEKRASMP